jgi:hypothetical protein
MAVRTMPASPPPTGPPVLPSVFSHDAYGSTTTTPDTADLARAAAYDAYGKPAATAGTAAFLDDLVGEFDLDNAALPTFGYRGELTRVSTRP